MQKGRQKRAKVATHNKPLVQENRYDVCVLAGMQKNYLGSLSLHHCSRHLIRFIKCISSELAHGGKPYIQCSLIVIVQ